LDSAERVAWNASPEWRAVLLGPQGLRLDEWRRDGRLTVIKHGEHRTVYRVDLAGRSFYVKHYRCRGWLRLVQHLVRASSSRREWRKSLEAARRGIATVKPVALGEGRRSGFVADSFLVTEALPRVTPVADFARDILPALDAADRAATRRRLVEALARFVAATHAAGVLHDDFHTGNVLVQLDDEGRLPADEPRLFLIDLPGVGFSGPLGWAATRASLVMLFVAHWLNASATDRWRFWRAYRQARNDLDITLAEGARQIVAAARPYARRLFRGRDKRCMRWARGFQRLDVSAGVGHAVYDVPAETLEDLLVDPGRFLRQGIHAPVKMDHSSIVVEARLPLRGGPVRIAFKRLRVRRWWKRWLGYFRRSRAVAAWQLGHGLLARGVATARPLAACTPCGPARLRESYLATLWIEGAMDVHAYASRLAAYPEHERRRRVREAAASLGRLVGRMHAWRINNRDLKGNNLLLAERPDRVDAWLIDLDGVRVQRRLSARTRAKNLARFAVSMELYPWITRTDRLRFLRAYLSAHGQEAPPQKWLWERVSTRALATVARKRRQRVPLA
jgi:tRNA A-37 threonylcarbamoyl transferase component Bud32